MRYLSWFFCCALMFGIGPVVCPECISEYSDEFSRSTRWTGRLHRPKRHGGRLRCRPGEVTGLSLLVGSWPLELDGTRILLVNPDQSQTHAIWDGNGACGAVLPTKPLWAGPICSDPRAVATIDLSTPLSGEGIGCASCTWERGHPFPDLKIDLLGPGVKGAPIPRRATSTAANTDDGSCILPFSETDVARRAPSVGLPSGL